jgi:hypothetical protein
MAKFVLKSKEEKLRGEEKNPIPSQPSGEKLTMKIY